MSAAAVVFGAVDYSVFGIMLCVSLAIGIYFGFFGRQSNSAQQYLSGVQDINLTSIGISLVASAISANLLLSFPNEVYSYGAMTLLLIPLLLPILLVVAYVYIPVYFKTGVTNAYEYLERRFDWKVSRLVSMFFVVYTYSYTPIVQYMPCLAFSQVTGLNVHVINTVIGLICVIYTVIGGIKAVIWTDVVQAAIMYISALAVIVYGIINVGGIGVVFERSREGGRLDMFDFDPDLTKRNTFWIMLSNCAAGTGMIAYFQTSVQRLIALKSEVQARKVILVYFIGTILIYLLSIFTGLVIFATYYKCDPIKSGVISKGDKIVPYFVMSTIGHWIGMPGLFISAMFSASFSTLSAQMNSLSGIVYNDYFRKWRLFDHTDFRASLFMKMVVVITGVYFISAGFIIDSFSHIFQITIIISGPILGVTTGVFTLGMLTPWANKYGAFYGTIISGVISIWMIAGNQMALKSGSLSYPPLPTSVEDCEYLKDNITTVTNATLNSILPATPDKPFILFRLSFYFFSMVSVILVWVFGLLISFMTGYTKPGELDKDVLATCMHWLLPKDSSVIIPTSENEMNRYVNKRTFGTEEEEELQIPLNKMRSAS